MVRDPQLGIPVLNVKEFAHVVEEGIHDAGFERERRAVSTLFRLDISPVNWTTWTVHNGRLYEQQLS